MEHHVYFWLKDERKNEADRQAFEKSLSELFQIPEVAGGVWSVPADTEIRPVTDHSWDYALSMKFATQREHDVYQAHPDHDVFIARHKEWWAKVLVMDLK